MTKYVVITKYDDNSPNHVFGPFDTYNLAIRWAMNNLNETRRYSIKSLTTPKENEKQTSNQ